jgi:hypothetical protein
MRAFNPTAPAMEMIRSGYIIEALHSDVYRHLGGRADLEVGCRQIVAGGIGSGNTTELLLAYKWLQENSSAVVLFIDVSRETDLSVLNDGALVASFGLHLGRSLQTEKTGISLDDGTRAKVKTASKALQDFAYGKTDYIWVQDEDFEPPDFEPDDYDEPPQRLIVKEIKGKLVRPFPVLQRDLQEIRKPLEILIGLARTAGRDPIVIFDGLDRLITPSKFWSVVEQDFRLFQDLKVSVICTGPISILFDADKSVSDHFARALHLPAMRVSSASLREVVLRRQGEQLLTAEQIDSICHYSGGLLRDLITLGRDAAEEAYVSNADQIRDEDVTRAVRQLGESYLRGLGSQHHKLLQQLGNGEGFDITKPLAQELLATRRVVEYSGTEFGVHPSLLMAMEGTPHD